MPVAQGGINFSGGQRQRLAIARAVIRRPAIYLFDDAFSALDVHTDARVRAALGEVSADATVIIVAQRISTVAEADQIVVVEDGRVVGTERTSRCWPIAPPTPSSRIRRRSEPVSEAVVTQPLGRPIRGMVQAPTERSRDFKGSATRLVKRLTPQRGPTAAVILLGVGGIAIGVDRSAHPRPRHRPVVQRRDRARNCPRASPRSRRSRRRRARGDNTFADLLSGMNVVPGRGVDFGAVGRTLLLALAPVSRCRAADLDAGAAAQRGGAADHGRAAVRRRGQAASAPAVVLRHPAARRGAEPGHQRRGQHRDVAVDDDQPTAHVAADRRSPCW